MPVEAAQTLDVDPSLGCGTDADLRFAATDGGRESVDSRANENALRSRDGVVEAGDDAEVLDDEEDTDKCDECAELGGLPCFRCYMKERGYDVGGE